jgi:hypothetical protein
MTGRVWVLGSTGVQINIRGTAGSSVGLKSTIC